MIASLTQATDRPVEELDAARAMMLLAFAERIPTHASGALVLSRGGEKCGALLIEEGRICWAFSHGTKRYLQDLLRERCSNCLSPPELAEIMRECRETSRPLGEALVAGGHVTADVLREALLLHTSRSLLSLARLGKLTPKWVLHNTTTYDPQFTFSYPELVGSLAHQIDPDRAGVARVGLEHILPPGAMGGAFGFTAAKLGAIPLAWVGEKEISIADLQELARWAVGLSAQASQAGTRAYAQLARYGETTCVSWRQGGLLMVAICRRPGETARILRRLATEGNQHARI